MLDFHRFAQDYHIPVLEHGHHHCHEGWIQTHCPICSGGRNGWHLGFNTLTGAFNCWRCGVVNIRSFLAAWVGESEIPRIFATYKVGKNQNSVKSRQKKDKSHVDILTYPPGIGSLSTAHREWLGSRGFSSLDVEQRWGVQGVGALGGRWSWRVITPLFDDIGKIISYQGRTIIKDHKPRHLTLSDELSIDSPRKYLYGEHLLQNRKSVVVVEGVYDVWRLGAGAVATLGTSWTLDQAKRLRLYDNVFILFDNDQSGKKHGKSLADWLASNQGNVELISGLETDPADLSDSAAKNLMMELKI